MIADTINAAAHKNVLFLGETITDVYHFGNAIGMPRKAPIIAMRYSRTETFQGGVIAAARHAESFCATVHVASARRIVKERYVEESHSRKLFEVYGGNESIEVPFMPCLSDYDAVVVTDYGHGMFNAALIERLCAEARFLAVNVQTNAGNYGFNLATKWPHADYLCMDEVEARLATQNLDDVIEGSVEELACIAPRVAVTLGRDGAIGTGGVRVPAFRDVTVDTMGAGDAFFAVTAPIAEDASMEDLLLIGNAAGALKAQVLGHRQAVTKHALLGYLEKALRANR